MFHRRQELKGSCFNYPCVLALDRKAVDPLPCHCDGSIWKAVHLTGTVREHKLVE